jgi:hypothetical protein
MSAYNNPQPNSEAITKIGLFFCTLIYNAPNSYNILNPGRKFTAFSGPAAEIEEGRIEEQLDEFTEDSNWQATDKDIRDGNKPYDTPEYEENEEKGSWDVYSGKKTKNSRSPLSELTDIDEDDYEKLEEVNETPFLADAA